MQGRREKRRCPGDLWGVAGQSLLGCPVHVIVSPCGPVSGLQEDLPGSDVALDIR